MPTSETRKAQLRKNYRAWYLRNQEKAREYHRTYRDKHRPKWKQYHQNYYSGERSQERVEAKSQHNRSYMLRKKYNISEADYQKLVLECEGRCSICGCTPSKLHIDHDHATGQIRGLLCRSCNIGLGHFRDSQPLLEKAAVYIGINNSSKKS